MVSYIMYYYLFMKGYVMKRIVSLITLLALFAALVVPASAAKKPEFMLALGDSLTTGYGLENYVGAGDEYNCASYTNQVAEALGLVAKESYINKAVNGATSADMLALLPEIEKYIGYADLIVVTVGIYDLMEVVPMIASAVADKNITSLEGAINALSAATPAQFAALEKNTNYQTKLKAFVTKYEKNLGDICALLKTYAPEARVIFLQQYNPVHNVPGFGDFGSYADLLIGNINTSMEKISTENGYEVVDVPSVINENAVGLTNMLNYDVHLNADGHTQVARLLNTYLFTSFDTEEETEPETEPVTEPETTSAVVTEINEEKNAPETEPVAETSGCGSMLTLPATVLATAFAFYVLKKKHA